MKIPSKELCKLSIITVNRNNAEGLKRTIRSVINQSYKDFEYIIIDGASTDNSIDVIKEHEKDLSYWISEADKGIYNAMNKGIKQAHGEYCLFLNSGDYLFEKQAIDNFIKNYLKTDIYSCGCKLIKGKSAITHLPPKGITLFTFVCGSLPHPSTFIKRALLNEMNGYDENYKISSDWKFCLEALILKNASYLSADYITSVFDANTGISTTSGTMEEEKKFQIMQDYFPRIIPDYFPADRVRYEYFYNTFSYLSKNKTAMKIIFPLIRVMHRMIQGRNKNYRLIRIFHSKIRKSQDDIRMFFML